MAFVNMKCGIRTRHDWHDWVAHHAVAHHAVVRDCGVRHYGVYHRISCGRGVEVVGGGELG